MKPRLHRWAWASLLLSLATPAHALDLESVFQGLVLGLLAILAGIAAVIGILVATSKLLLQLGEPEPAKPVRRRAASRRIAAFTLPASVVAWALMAWLTYDPRGNWYYPAVPLTFLLGLVACLLLWWRQRPTAAKAVLGGLLVAGTAATVAYLATTQPPHPAPPAALGRVGSPVLAQAAAAAPTVPACA